MEQQRGSQYNAEYNVSWDVLNAADFGDPQTRRRVLIVAIQKDFLPAFKFPSPTHSLEALIAAQNNGSYWERHDIHPRRLGRGSPGIKSSRLLNADDLKPWRTVRDALQDLDEAKETERESDNNHWLIPGARLYPGHGGSVLDLPSKTIKAGVHGVPGGENCIHLDDGSFRYYTLRETARIQGFPDSYIFMGARSHVTRQIGNAVPCGLAEMVGKAMKELLVESSGYNFKTKSQMGVWQAT
jgi:DNA (cytosine-5)-methyltransferase 1